AAVISGAKIGIQKRRLSERTVRFEVMMSASSFTASAMEYQIALVFSSVGISEAFRAGSIKFSFISFSRSILLSFSIIRSLTRNPTRHYAAAYKAQRLLSSLRPVRGGLGV